MIISNQIVTTYLARPGNAVAVSGQVAGGMLNIGRASRTSANEVGLLEKQTRAFGTTMRYAFAGSVLFGMTSMIGKLNQLQQQMGLIAAIAPTSGARGLGTNWLGEMQDEIAQKAPAARTGIQEMNDAAINFLSTVQNAQIKDVPDVIAQLGITAKLSQTPTEDLTKALTTMNVAAGRMNNMKNLNGLMRQRFQLISQAPGGVPAAPQIAQQLGPLAAVMMGLGPSTPEQMMGLTLGALKFGATPSVALRGLQYFTQSLFQPTSKEAAESLKAAGFTPERLQKEGPSKFILDYLTYINSLGKSRITKGGINRLTALGQAADFTGQEELMPNINIPGLSPQALAAMRTQLGRIHGIRTAAVLMRQIDPAAPGPSIQELIKQMDRLNKGVGKDAKDLEKAIGDYQNQTPLLGAATAIDALRATISRDIAPFLNIAGRGVTAGAQALQDRPNLRTGLEIGAGGLLAAMGVGAFMMRKKGGMGALLGRLGQRGGQGIVTGMAARDISDVGLGASPMNPMYVIVVGQIFGGQGTGTGGGPGIPPIVSTGGKTGRFGRMLGRVGIPLTAAWLASSFVDDKLGLGLNLNQYGFGNVRRNLGGLFGGGGDFNQLRRFKQVQDQQREFPRLSAMMSGMDKTTDPFQRQILDQFAAGRIGPGRAEKKLERLKFQASLDRLDKINALGPTGRFQTEGDLDININLKHPSGKVQTRRKKLSAAAYNGGKVPTARGRKKSVKADFPVDIFPDWFRPEGQPRT